MRHRVPKYLCWRLGGERDIHSAVCLATWSSNLEPSMEVPKYSTEIFRDETELDDKTQDRNRWSFISRLRSCVSITSADARRSIWKYGTLLYYFECFGIFRASDRGLEPAFCHITPDPDIGSSTCEPEHHKTVSPHPQRWVAKVETKSSSACHDQATFSAMELVSQVTTWVLQNCRVTHAIQWRSLAWTTFYVQLPVQ
jgi:hypothetical protein